MEKIPAESGPWTMGVLKTCQVCPRSGEWKTRAIFPPVANQMLFSGAEASLFDDCAGDAVDWSGALVASGGPGSLASLGMTILFRRLAGLALVAANAPSPFSAGGSWGGGMGAQVWPSFVVKSSNFNFPVSSAMGSPRAMPWVRSQK